MTKKRIPFRANGIRFLCRLTRFARSCRSGCIPIRAAWLCGVGALPVAQPPHTHRAVCPSGLLQAMYPPCHPWGHCPLRSPHTCQGSAVSIWYGICNSSPSTIFVRSVVHPTAVVAVGAAVFRHHAPMCTVALHMSPWRFSSVCFWSLCSYPYGWRLWQYLNITRNYHTA